METQDLISLRHQKRKEKIIHMRVVEEGDDPISDEEYACIPSKTNCK